MPLASNQLVNHSHKNLKPEPKNIVNKYIGTCGDQHQSKVSVVIAMWQHK
jgi:hypothetical protein